MKTLVILAMTLLCEMSFADPNAIYTRNSLPEMGTFVASSYNLDALLSTTFSGLKDQFCIARSLRGTDGGLHKIRLAGYTPTDLQLGIMSYQGHDRYHTSLRITIGFRGENGLSGWTEIADCDLRQ